MDLNALTNALAKQVPAMQRGFTVQTHDGEITVPPGWMADRIADLMEHLLRCEKLVQAAALLPKVSA